MLYSRFLASLRTVLALDALLSLAMLPFGGFKSTLITLVLVSTTASFLYKTLVRPEKSAYVSAASEIRHKATSLRFLASVLTLGIPASIYFSKLVAPSSSIEQYTIKHFERFDDMEGIPDDWSLHTSFDMLSVNDSFLYGMGLSWGLALAFAIYIIAYEPTVLRARNSTKGHVISLLKEAVINTAGHVGTIWGTVVTVWPIVHLQVVRKHYLLFSPYLLGKAAQYEMKSLDGFELVKDLFVIPALFLPIVIVWSVSLEVFRLLVTPTPVTKGELLSNVSEAKNDSLLTGLAASPSSTTALMAWGELLIIAEHDEKRRKLIYEDIEGDSGAWPKIVTLALTVLRDHIEALRKPHKEAEKEKPKAEEESALKQIFKKYASAKNTHESVNVQKENAGLFHHSEPLLNPNSALEKKFSKFAHSLESSSTTRAEKARVSLHHIYEAGVKHLRAAEDILLSHYPGILFRKSTERILETQLRHKQTTAFTAHAVARLMTHSIAEDENGYVQDTIAPFLAAVNELSEELENVIKRPPIDRTDVKARTGAVEPDVAVAEEVLSHLNLAFTEVSQVFKPYFTNLNVDNKVIKRSARTDLVLADSAYLP